MKNLKKNKGITLIALVVTIVVLIILATISINAVMGEDGLIKRAEQASQHQANAEASESGLLEELDKYISDATTEKGEKLKITYTISDVDKSGKLVSLDYLIKTGEETTAEEIEAKLEELAGETIPEETKSEWKNAANTIGITYEEYLLELLVQISLEEEITEEMRQGLQAEAESVEMTYQEYLEYALQEFVGISFEKERITIEELENALAQLRGEEKLDEEWKTQWKEHSTSVGISYREILTYFIEVEGGDTDAIKPITLEVSIGNIKTTGINSKFVATKNGTYTVTATTEDGMKSETQIVVTGIEEEKFSSIYETTMTYTDASGATATIPAGFAVGTSDGINTIADGLVITDAVDSEGYSIGNEFVWIPVASDETFIRESFESIELETTKYTEPYASGYSDGSGTEEVAEYNTMRTQVLKYNGFYIGRYEAGINKTTKRTGETEAQGVVVKRGVATYNYVAWGESMSDIGTNGAAYLSQNMYTESNSVTSTLCYGVQWDAMCRYIEDYERTHDIDKIKPDLTGITNGDNSKNIYDLAGNVQEWTMETYDTSKRVTRGFWNKGDNIKNPIYLRSSKSPEYSNRDVGFRITLYINE